MHFFIDESGTFSIPVGIMKHKACVSLCFVISDLKMGELKTKYDSFCSELPKQMLVNGEPKGSKFDINKRLAFCEVLNEFRDYLLIIPVTLDMTFFAMLDLDMEMKEITSNKCIELCDYVEHETMKEDLRLLSKQIKNLSSEEFLKISSHAYAFYICLRHSIMALSTNGNENSWHNLEIIIDRLNPKMDSREKIIFANMVGMWIESWSRNEPFTLLKDIHTDEHPFVKNFDLGKGLSGHKISSKIKWEDSKKFWGLQIADIASNIIFNAVNDLDNEKESFMPFCHLMKLSTYGYDDGAGLYSPVELKDEDNRLIKAKYKKLGEEMIKFGFRKNYYANILDRVNFNS